MLWKWGLTFIPGVYNRCTKEWLYRKITPTIYLNINIAWSNDAVLAVNLNVSRYPLVKEYFFWVNDLSITHP